MSEADKIIKNLKNSGKKVEEFYVSNKTSDKNVANDSVIAHKFAVMQQQINEKDKRIQELEKALLKVKDKNATLFITCRNSIPKQVVIDKIDELGISDEDINIRYVLQELLEGAGK